MGIEETNMELMQTLDDAWNSRTGTPSRSVTRPTRSSAGPRNRRPTAFTIIAPRAFRYSRSSRTIASRIVPTRHSLPVGSGHARSLGSTAP